MSAIHSIRSKVLAAIVSITLLTATAIAVTFYFKSSQMIEDNYCENLYGRMEQIGNAFDDSLKEMYYITVHASCSDEILNEVLEFKNTNSESILENIAVLLKEYKKRYSDIGSVYLVLPDENIVVTSQDYPVYEKDIDRKYIEILNRDSQSAATPKVKQNPLRSSSKFLSFTNTVTDESDRILAYIMVNVEERAIFYKYVDNLYDGKASEIVILDENSKIVSSQNSEYMGELYQNKNFYMQNHSGVINSNLFPTIGIFYKTAFSGFSFFMTVEKSEILSDLNELRYFLILFLILFICISIVPSYLITKTMYKPIKNLIQTMERVSGGDLEQRVNVTTDDEIGILSNEFNIMLDNVNELIEKLVKEEMLKKDAELEALQYQITPHFMYNTLNSIKYSALIKGEKELGGLIGDFVELLQASINKMGTFITVADELHLLQNYIHLQQIRYEGHFNVVYKIAQNAKGCFLPRLLLQPIVENSILHGLDMKNKDSKITVQIWIDIDTLYIDIQDNGRGMTDEQIHKLLTDKTKKLSGLSGIGVSNIKERLELYYGKKARISYESSKDGTTVHIFLPAYREPNEYSI